MSITRMEFTWNPQVVITVIGALVLIVGIPLIAWTHVYAPMLERPERVTYSACIADGGSVPECLEYPK
ncbi:hypothetical protein [Microbacterium sp. MTN4-26]|uniref:hypothetical protein n=1 Tax=unclassified Microbacterium TaxID=2609290 RepID=UPI0036F3C896